MIANEHSLFRYIPFERFCQMLFMKELVLVSPSKWPDKYEEYWLKRLSSHSGQKNVEEYAKRFDGNAEEYKIGILKLCEYIFKSAFCLCFSKKCDEEVLWNTHSDEHRCVMYATTYDKVYNIVHENASTSIHDVQYDLETYSDIMPFLEKFSVAPSVTGLSSPEDVLLHKRECFSYESEVRLIRSQYPADESGVLKYPIEDVSSFFEGIIIHPLASEDYVSLVEKICEHFGIPFWGKSRIYEFEPSQEDKNGAYNSNIRNPG